MESSSRKLLSAMDMAKIQCYHFKAIVVAGMGLFSDSYDLFCIPPLMKILGHVYYSDKVPTPIVSTMVGLVLLGTAIGQVLFGCLGDVKGRRSVYGLALMIMVLSSLGCGFSICTSRGCVLGSLGFFRLLLGVGIGGDYPLSATIMSEFANTRTRGAFMAAVFSMQGFGILASSAVTMVVCKVFEVASGFGHHHPPIGADIAWRVIMMLGALPALLTFYWRMMMPETARYTALVENNGMQATKDMEKVLTVDVNNNNGMMSPIAEEQSTTTRTRNPYPLLSIPFLRRHGLHLFSCASCWFLLDIVFYSSNLFQSQIYRQFWKIGPNSNVYQEAFDVAFLQAVVAVCSTIPGYFFTVYFIDRIGRRKIQIMGFFFMGMVYLALGIPYSYWHDNKNNWFMVLYGLNFFFSNFGPNTTTFIVPAELFPARLRSTCHGIAGASGKLGAAIGSLAILFISENEDKQGLPEISPMTAALLSLGGVCLLGMLVSYFFMPETMGRSLEDNETQDMDYQLPLFTCFTFNAHPSPPSFRHVSPL